MRTHIYHIFDKEIRVAMLWWMNNNLCLRYEMYHSLHFCKPRFVLSFFCKYWILWIFLDFSMVYILLPFKSCIPLCGVVFADFSNYIVFGTFQVNRRKWRIFGLTGDICIPLSCLFFSVWYWKVIFVLNFICYEEQYTDFSC